MPDFIERWTKASVLCYKRGCVCQGCIYSEIMDTPCRMKRTVIELVKKLGAPPEKKLDGLKDTERTVIEAILDGCNTKSDIAVYCDYKEPKVQTVLNNLCMIVQTQGYLIRNVRNRLPELTEILREIYDTRDE